MPFGSEDYQLKDSHFIVVHPFTYVVIGIFVLISITAIAMKLKKR